MLDVDRCAVGVSSIVRIACSWHHQKIPCTPAAGRVELSLTRRRTVEETVVLPSPFSVQLVEGLAVVDLAPTGPSWCWRVVERVRNGKGRYVAVPDSESPIAYTDLVDVDPETLEPDAEPEAAWWATVEQLDTDLSEQVVSGEVRDDDLILVRRDGTEVDAGDVRGPQGDEGPTGPEGPPGPPGFGVISGTGSPLGQVAAPPGTIYSDTEGTLGAWVWVKTSGTGTGGWHVMHGDTGWRSVTQWGTDGVVTGWPFSGSWGPRDGVAGSIQIRRYGDDLRIYVQGAERLGASPSSVWDAGHGFGPGLRPHRSTPAQYQTNAGSSTLILSANDGGLYRGTGALAGVDGRLDQLYFTAAAHPNTPWPTSLPGTPA